MNAPDISIVIPVYNGAEYVKLAIESALAQRTPAREIVVLDDASTDATPSVLATYASNPRIRLERLAVRKPAPGAWNEAIRRSSGEYVVVLAHDDLLDETFIAEASKVIAEDPSIDVVITMHRTIDHHGEFMETVAMDARGETYPGVMSARSYFDRFTKTGQFFLPTAVVMRRATFEKLNGFDERLQVAYDWDFFLRLGVAKIYVLPQALISYRIHPSQSIERYVKNDNGDNDVIFRKLPELTSVMTEEESRRVVEGMCDFMRRIATRQLRDRKIPAANVVATAQAIGEKLRSWRAAENPMAKYVELKPRRLGAKIGWRCAHHGLGVRLLRLFVKSV